MRSKNDRQLKKIQTQVLLENTKFKFSASYMRLFKLLERDLTDIQSTVLKDLELETNNLFDCLISEFFKIWELDSKISEVDIPKFSQLNYRQLKIIEYLKSYPSITRREYALLYNISFMTAFRDLSQMVDDNILLVIGVQRGTKYILKSE